MEIVSYRKEEIVIERSLCFEYPGEPGCGFSFPCDEKGIVDTTKLEECAIKNFKDCVQGINGTRNVGVITYKRKTVEPTVIRCEVCGNEVPLAYFTNTCDECETDYNMFGSRLAPRRYWGEETGETASDILNGNWGY